MRRDILFLVVFFFSLKGCERAVKFPLHQHGNHSECSKASQRTLLIGCIHTPWSWFNDSSATIRCLHGSWRCCGVAWIRCAWSLQVSTLRLTRGVGTPFLLLTIYRTYRVLSPSMGISRSEQHQCHKLCMHMAAALIKTRCSVKQNTRCYSQKP